MAESAPSERPQKATMVVLSACHSNSVQLLDQLPPAASEMQGRRLPWTEDHGQVLQARKACGPRVLVRAWGPDHPLPPLRAEKKRLSNVRHAPK